MITLASGLRVYLACRITDMRKGMTGLAMLVQQTLAEDPFICVGRDYVAARSGSGGFRGSGELGRHIISAVHGATAARLRGSSTASWFTGDYDRV
jgi:hypothetical protein